MAARSAARLWAASLVCASATARAVESAGLGVPSYVITGWFPDRPERAAADDVLTAELIERARVGQPLDAAATAAAVLGSDEAAHTLALGDGHVHPHDIVLATRIDAFTFGMEVHRIHERLVLRSTISRRRPRRSGADD